MMYFTVLTSAMFYQQTLQFHLSIFSQFFPNYAYYFLGTIFKPFLPSFALSLSLSLSLSL